MMEIRDDAQFGDVQANITMRTKVPQKALPPPLTVHASYAGPSAGYDVEYCITANPALSVTRYHSLRLRNARWRPIIAQGDLGSLYQCCVFHCECRSLDKKCRTEVF